MSNLEASAIREEEALVINIEGKLDTLGAPVLDAFCEEHIAADDQRVVFDLGQTVYVSSAGLRSILKVAKMLDSRSGSLVVCGLQDMVEKVFRHAGFDTFLRIESCRQEALRALDS